MENMKQKRLGPTHTLPKYSKRTHHSLSSSVGLKNSIPYPIDQIETPNMRKISILALVFFQCGAR